MLHLDRFYLCVSRNFKIVFSFYSFTDAARFSDMRENYHIKATSFELCKVKVRKSYLSYRLVRLPSFSTNYQVLDFYEKGSNCG